jgi:hypothetical protein
MVLTLAVLAAAALTWTSSAAVPGVINVTATREHFVYRSVQPPGRQSDGMEQAWRITDRRGRPLGRMLLRCRWVLRDARLCDGELTMPHGKIAFSGSSPTTFFGEYAVNGGTGVYLGVGGVLRFTAIGQSKNALLVTVTT